MKKFFGVALVLAFASFIFISNTSQIASTIEKLAVGDAAPTFNLKNVDGKMVSLEDYNGKGAIVIFTCNHCPFSVMYEDRILMLNKRYTAMGYPVIAINPNSPEVAPTDSFDKMVERAEEKKFDFPYLFDDGQKIYPQYGAERTPHVFILDKDHVVRYIGAIDDSARDESKVTINYVETTIKALLNGNEPDPTFTKAIGCSIKS